MIDHSSTKKSESLTQEMESNEDILAQHEQQIQEILNRLGKTKKRILIELYKHPIGYKKLSKILGTGMDTIRSHIKSGKYSKSLHQMALLEKGPKGWQLTPLGLEVVERLREDPEYRSYFY